MHIGRSALLLTHAAAPATTGRGTRRSGPTLCGTCKTMAGPLVTAGKTAAC